MGIKGPHPDLFELEEGSELRLNFGRFRSQDGTGVIPVAVQDVDTGELLLIGHASQLRLNNRSKQKLPHSGACRETNFGSKGQPRAIPSNWSKFA